MTDRQHTNVETQPGDQADPRRLRAQTEFVNAPLLKVYAAYLFADLLKTPERTVRIVQAFQTCTKLKKEPNNLNPIAGLMHSRSEVSLFGEKRYLEDLYGKNFTPPMGLDDDARGDCWTAV